MDYGVFIALGGMILGAAAFALAIAGAWVLGRNHERRDTQFSTASTTDVMQRLERIEHMLDTLSTDIERIAESRDDARQIRSRAM